jgi:hypothetical protein
MSVLNQTRRGKVHARLVSATETTLSYAALASTAVVAAASLMAAYQPVTGAWQAYRQAEAIYRPNGELVKVQRTKLTEAKYRELAAQAQVPGVDVSVSAQGLVVQASDALKYQAWRTAVDRVRLAAPELQWTAPVVCAGQCGSSAAFKAVLVAELVDARVAIEAGEGSPGAAR